MSLEPVQRCTPHCGTSGPEGTRVPPILIHLIFWVYQTSKKIALSMRMQSAFACKTRGGNIAFTEFTQYKRVGGCMMNLINTAAADVDMTQPKVTCFQKAFDKVPQLWHHCAMHAVNGVKGMRLVCKALSTACIKEVRSYCVKLLAQPSLTEPLVDVAKLLKHSQLTRLCVEVSLPTGSYRIRLPGRVSFCCYI